jgi:hypothetical protein
MKRGRDLLSPEAEPEGEDDQLSIKYIKYREIEGR